MKIEALNKSLFTEELVKKKIKEIFFESSSRKIFESEKIKQQFFHDWTDFYFNNCLEDIFLATSKDNILGYLTGCRNSDNAQKYLNKKISSYSLFADQFLRYPAHLHINLAAEARGHGLGTALVENYVEFLETKNCPGLHIVTATQARNQKFYERLGFSDTICRTFANSQLLFMGRPLSRF